MSNREKLLARLCTRPTDFTWRETASLLRGFGFKEVTGKGARRKYVHPDTGVIISLHAPHSPPHLKRYLVDLLLSKLKETGVIDDECNP